MSSSSDKRVQVKIEVGHQSICRNVATPTGFTHDWNIFVRGAEGNDISHFVEKVVFLLHESFHKPKRVCKEPPYRVAESGYGSFNLPVEIHFRNNKEEPRKYRLDYDLFLQLLGKPPVNHIKVEALTFLNPSDDFEAKLLRGGACILPPLLSSLAPVSKSEPHISHISKSISPTFLELNTVNQNKSSTPSNTTKLPKLSSQQSHSTKRLLQSDDDLKFKKRKVEKSDAGLQTSSAKPLKDVPILTNVSNSDSNDVLKGKGFLQTYKKPKELKKVNEVQSAINSPTASKPKELKHRGKELKTKKEKVSSPESSLKDDLPKLPKFLITRMTDDVYVKKSTATNGGVIMTNGGNINLNHSVNHVNSSNSHEHAIQPESKSVSALLAEFGQDDHSSDDSMHIDLLSDLTKTSKADIPTSVVTSVAHTSENSNKNTLNPKKSKVHKSILNGDSNVVQKREVAKIRATDAGKTLPKPSPTTNDLYELYKALNNCQDDDKLQKVVDIVEESGQFDITATTFDFNLCLLDQESITLLKQLILS